MSEAASSMRKANGSPSIREAVERLQRRVQRHLEAEVRAHTGGQSPALERYYREYMREFRRYQKVSSYGELHEALLDSDVVFIGDYHTLRQSQEVALRLLLRALADERPVVLALEMIHAGDQAALDAYMNGDLDEERFLRAIRYEHTWNFDWRNYRPLFEAARHAGISVHGINHAVGERRGRFRQRDARIADSLASLVEARPEARMLVLIGDMHLAPKHLPRALEERLEVLNFPRRRLIVYQNSDTLYWSLVRRGSELDTQVVRLGRDRYCVMDVPPYVKLQSYLGWERAMERFDAEGWEEAEEATGQTVLEHLVRQLSEFLELPAADVGCEVFSNLDESFFDALENAEHLGEARSREIRLHAFTNRSCYAPDLDLVYLPFFSVNHAAEEAMHLLMVQHGWPAVPSTDRYEGFYERTLWWAFGYVASKIVNARRRAADPSELRSFQKVAGRDLRDPALVFRKVVARLVLQHKEHEGARRRGRRGRLKQIYEQELEILLEVTSTLGYILGEAMAQALRAGTLSRENLRDMVLQGSRPRAAAAAYFDLVDRFAR